MSNIYLKATIEKNGRSQKFLGSSNSSLNFKSSCYNVKIKGVRAKLQLVYYFDFERNYDVLKSKSPCILLDKNINFIKTERNLKWKIPHTFLKR